MKKFIKPIIVIAILITLLITALALDLFEKIDINKLEEFQNWLEGFGIYIYLVFILVYVIAVVFALPASTLTILSGIMFGPFRGGIVALIAATVGATVAFLLSRYLIRDFIQYKFKEKELFKKVEAGVDSHGIDFLIFTRLVPIFPFTLQNYAYGLTSMKLIPYVVVSFITMIPGAFLYTFLAGDIVANGLGFRTLIIFTIACLLLFLLSQIVKRIARKKGIEVSK